MVMVMASEMTVTEMNHVVWVEEQQVKRPQSAGSGPQGLSLSLSITQPACAVMESLHGCINQVD